MGGSHSKKPVNQSAPELVKEPLPQMDGVSQILTPESTEFLSNALIGILQYNTIIFHPSFICIHE